MLCLRMNDLVLTSSGGSMTIANFKLMATGVEIARKATEDEWSETWSFVRRCEGSVMWWLGERIRISGQTGRQMGSEDLEEVMSVNISEILEEFPVLRSPAHLAIADTDGRWKPVKHLMYLNQRLVEMVFGDLSRLMNNMPYQVGKSKLTSEYFPAWCLLWKPDWRILLGAHGEDFATGFGSSVKSIVNRWGKPLGIGLKEDTRAKGEWKIEGYDGGMVCRGVGGDLMGRAADLFLIDDPIKSPEQVMSPTIMDKQWAWYETLVTGRLRNDTKIAITMTRWSKRDICGRILNIAKQTGEEWEVVKFKAIAGENDILGRKPGEALWPEQVSLEKLERIRATNRWWSACWQQEPVEEEGAYFKPKNWPTYVDLSQAWSIQQPGLPRKIYHRDELVILAVVDWAATDGKKSDYTAVGVFGLTSDGKLLILDFVNVRVRLESVVGEVLAPVCRRWCPNVTACEAHGFQAALANECRRHREIGEVLRLQPESKSKLGRALPAITQAENGRVYLPEKAPEWYEVFVDQVSSFNGVDDEHDDMVDCLTYACQKAVQLRPSGSVAWDEGGGPSKLDEGKSPAFGKLI